MNWTNLMVRDPYSLEEIEWTLWCTLSCQCDQCQTILDLQPFDKLADFPIQWAKATAPYVKSKGWSAPGEWELLCGNCSSAEAVK